MLRDYVRFTAVCAVAMAVLLTGLALVRDTTGYDWYAAARLTLTQAMLAVGFDPYASTEYRMGSGLTLPMIRGVLTELDGPREARARILSAIADHAGLGAVSGIGCAATLLIWLGSGGRWARLPAMREPARAPHVPWQLRDRYGVAEDFPRPGEGDARIGLTVVSSTDARGVAHVWDYVDLGVAVPPGGIGRVRLAAGAEAARRAPDPEGASGHGRGGPEGGRWRAAGRGFEAARGSARPCGQQPCRRQGPGGQQTGGRQTGGRQTGGQQTGGQQTGS